MILLHQPWFLVLLVVIPLIWWAWSDARRRAAIRFSGTERVAAASQSKSARARYVVPLLRCLAVALIVLAIARPQKADEQTRVQTEGVAIQLVVDRSGSMSQEDMLDEEGNGQSRLAALKQVVERFVRGDGKKLQGRPDDLIGLIDFARYADTECPMTLDHEQLLRSVAGIQVPRTREEDGTAIGDALLLAVERVRNIERKLQKKDDFKIKSRVIILLTDGEQNAGKYKPEKAAEAAAALGLKIYTIGVAPEFQEQTVGGFFSQRQKVRVPVTVDEESLRKVAESTGGKYFRAKDVSSLREIYTEIDHLERSAVDETRYYLFEELAYNWAHWGPWRLSEHFQIGTFRTPPPLLVALALLALELILAHTRFRRIP
ncbi:MAG TPA: VWA domain-containing protein [Phycisphaerae bacterium]|nr:VWA domain-containing protein [Phycisphaerae bacterium]